MKSPRESCEMDRAARKWRGEPRRPHRGPSCSSKRPRCPQRKNIQSPSSRSLSGRRWCAPFRRRSCTTRPRRSGSIHQDACRRFPRGSSPAGSVSTRPREYSRRASPPRPTGSSDDTHLPVRYPPERPGKKVRSNPILPKGRSVRSGTPPSTYFREGGPIPCKSLHNELADYRSPVSSRIATSATRSQWRLVRALAHRGERTIMQILTARGKAPDESSTGAATRFRFFRASYFPLISMGPVSRRSGETIQISTRRFLSFPLLPGALGATG